ncbi:MAG: thioredoxin family protein [Phycisphaeraceae bacterium]
MDPQTKTTKQGLPIGWIVAVLLVALTWAGAHALRGDGDGTIMPGWADGIEAGQALAQDADKPMVVLFTAGWCPPCKQLKKQVLTQGEVNKALQAGFVPVQIDLTDTSSSNPNLATAEHYGVQGIPAVIAMTPEGKTIEVYRGGPDSAGFMDWLNRLAK